MCNLLLEKKKQTKTVNNCSIRSCAALTYESVAEAKAGEIPLVPMINSNQSLKRFNMTPA